MDSRLTSLCRSSAPILMDCCHSESSAEEHREREGKDNTTHHIPVTQASQRNPSISVCSHTKKKLADRHTDRLKQLYMSLPQ